MHSEVEQDHLTPLSIELSGVALGGIAVAAAAVAVLGLTWALDHALATFWLFGLAFGIVLQRSRFCFHAAFRDLFGRRRAGMMKAVLAGLAIATLGFTWVMAGRVAEPALGFRPVEAHVVPLGFNVVLGGFLFGLGMMLSRGCISRSMCHMGEGHVSAWVTIAGVLVGLSLSAHTWNRWWLYDMQYRKLVWLPNTLGYGGALVVTIGTLTGIFLLVHWWTARAGELGGSGHPDDGSAPAADTARSASRQARPRGQWSRPFRRSWPVMAGGIILGLLNVALYAAYQPWGLVGELSRWAEAVAALVGLPAGPLLGVDRLPMSCSLGRNGSGLLTRGLMLDVGMVLGAFLAAQAAGEFRLRTSDRSYYAQSAVGGTLMGYGAGLAVGCTIGALFSAIPSLALNGWVFGGTLALGAYLGLRLVDRW